MRHWINPTSRTANSFPILPDRAHALRGKREGDCVEPKLRNPGESATDPPLPPPRRGLTAVDARLLRVVQQIEAAQTAPLEVIQRWYQTIQRFQVRELERFSDPNTPLGQRYHEHVREITSRPTVTQNTSEDSRSASSESESETDTSSSEEESESSSVSSLSSASSSDSEEDKPKTSCLSQTVTWTDQRIKSVRRPSSPISR